MVILGLTGSIGMGKTVAAATFRRLGVPVHDADAAVHALMAPAGAAFAAIAERFPDAVVDGVIDRRQLGDRVFGDEKSLNALEGILHPLVRRSERAFLRHASADRAPIVVLDIPLLLETGGDRRVDAVVVVSAPAFVQRHRVLARPGMSEGKFQDILAKQVPDRVKRRRADFIIESGNGRLESLRTIRKIIAETRTWEGHHWPPLPAAIRRIRPGSQIR